MACRGIRPDGHECTCSDEFTDLETGLCASCAAPESTALVPVGSTDLMAHPELDALYKTMPPKVQAFINAYTKTHTIVKAAKAAGCHRNWHRYWMKNVPGYPELFEVVELDTLDHLRDLYADRVENGLKEMEYDADGNLKRTRIRQSEGLLKALMIAKDPEFTPDKSGTNIQINIVQKKEGWGDEEDQQHREIPRDEEGKVTSRTAEVRELDRIPEVESVPCETQGTNEVRPDRSGYTWRQRQHRAQSFSEWPDDE